MNQNQAEWKGKNGFELFASYIQHNGRGGKCIEWCPFYMFLSNNIRLNKDMSTLACFSIIPIEELLPQAVVQRCSAK